ncbi:MAG: 4-hydroxy-tetrahydrodipicolinate reductase [Candidatus Omnitrophota bacterium]
MIKLGISGCQGRMGLRILHLAQEDKEFRIASLLEHKNHPAVGGQVDKIPIASDVKNLKKADVLIEFSSPEATMAHCDECVKNNVKMVIGTTGLSDEQIQKISKASEKIAIVFASNMSVGVNVLFKLAQIVSEKTSNAYAVKITEAHHVHKKDAPSGTAKSLAQIIQNATGAKVENIKSIREDEIVGDHEVVFESKVDTITIGHHAKTRDIFAEGSLVAAKYVSAQKKGLFNMQDVLQLK